MLCCIEVVVKASLALSIFTQALLQLYIDRASWDAAFALAAAAPQLRKALLPSYAAWLASNDRVEEACAVYRSVDCVQIYTHQKPRRNRPGRLLTKDKGGMHCGACVEHA